MKKEIDITNKKFGRWTAIKFSHKDKNGQHYWLCQCECGTVKTVNKISLLQGKTLSCGCYSKEINIIRSTKHNLSHTRIYRIYSAIKARCYNEKALNYVMSKGYKCIQWDVDSVDWKQAGADVEYNRVMKNVKEGSILLFHNNAKYTPENLDRIINKLTGEGYKFLTVSELVYDDNYYIDENGVQNKK